MTHILGISGSLRARSYNTAALRAAADIAPDHIKIDVFDLAGLPMFNPDDEAVGPPAVVADLRAAVAAADGLLIATPEYNWSVTAALKNAIDWASRGPDSPLNRKPTAILGVGGRFGTIRAQMHLREILGHNDVRLVGNPTVAIDMGSRKFDEDLILTDERHRDQIARLLAALDDLIAIDRTLREPV